MSKVFVFLCVCVFGLQSSVLLLILSEMSCVMEVNGEDQVVAAEVQNLTPVQMGNIRVSDLMAGLVQSKLIFIYTFVIADTSFC